MPLVDSFLLDPAKLNVWIALRTDNVEGSGAASDPYNGNLRFGPAIPVTLPDGLSAEIVVSTGSRPHGFSEGDMVQLSGVTGPAAVFWNQIFGIYNVTPVSFTFATTFAPGAPQGNPTASLVTFQFDKIVRNLLPGTRVNIGPGIFQTRGYAPQGVNSWQPKAGQKIVGSGMDVTTIQLVGAAVADQHYHAIGMSITPSGITPAAPIDGFEISDLTIDSNLDNQPLRGSVENNYTPVACGAVRIFGSHCLIRRVKAINWGSKTFKEGCFVFSIIDASAETTDGSGQPVLQETTASGIEDCIAVQPASSARETTVLHIGGRKNPTNHAQGFATAPFIRRNFVDGGFQTSRKISNNKTDGLGILQNQSNPITTIME